MWRNLIIQAIYQVTVLLVLNFAAAGILNLDTNQRGQRQPPVCLR
ncbi:Calcium-transporting ATPase 10, plasma membrane-type [Orobanche gracilis]